MEKDVLNKLVEIIPKIQREFVKIGSSPLTKGAITMPQMILLQTIYEKNMCTMGDLAKNMGVTKSAITALADRLIRQKLITRTGGIKDRRIVIISLTEKGKNSIKKLMNEREQVIKKAFSVLTVGEQKTYLHLIKKIYNSWLKK